MAQTDDRTMMHQEAAEAGAAVARLLERNGAAVRRLGATLAGTPPPFVTTCARGSSDHAATYAKYLIETRLGVPTVSVAPSTASLFAAPVVAAAGRPLCLAVSQSGRSPDLLASVERQRATGARVVALVNDEGSPLAAMADEVLPLCAGPERSVAATKSFICSLAGVAALVAAWTGDEGFAAALAGMPAVLERSFALDWSPAAATLAGARNLFVIGRGYGLSLAQEVALKLKETCGLHGEAFSAAEVRHGPMAIVGDRFPILAFATDDAAGDDVRAVCDEFAARGARVWLADARPRAAGAVGILPALPVDPALAPLTLAASAYAMIDALALARGIDADHPPYLSKVTRTR